MNDQVPPRLYKYQGYSARTLTALKMRAIWFGSPSGFNDPFDCAVPLRFGPVTARDCQRLVTESSDPEWAALIHDRQLFSAEGLPTEAMRTQVEGVARKTVEDISEDTYLKRGVACFSETCDNLLLWSHYGAGHRGLCLEFDTSSPFLNRLHRVQYSDEVPEIDLVEMTLGRTQKMISLLLTKATCWSYEREWRAIHSEARTVSFYGVDALTAVYLGAELRAAEKDVVAHLLHGTPTKLFEMRRSTSSFRLESRLVEYTPYRHGASPNV